VISVKLARERLGVTYVSAQNNVKKLVAHGILHEISGRQRNRIYLAPQIIDVIESQRPE